MLGTGSVFVDDFEVYTLFISCTINRFPLRRDACGREDGGNEGEFLADIVGDAKAAGSSNDQARFQGYEVNLVIISCFTVVERQNKHKFKFQNAQAH